MEKEDRLSIHAATRHHGVDLLRLLSMYMVLILHILGPGGVFKTCTLFSGVHITAWTLEALAYCAVNCYALISGYVGICSRYKYTNILVLWLQAFLYSFGGTLIFYILRPGSVDGITLFKSLFPVTAVSNNYWYFSAYLGLFFLKPLLDRGILSLDRRQAKTLCLTIVIVFSVIPTLSGRDPFVTDDGYSPLWLLAIYILGACIRRFRFLSGVKTRSLILGYLLSAAATVGVYLFLAAGHIPFLAYFYDEYMLMNYVSPTILFCGTCLFLLFTRMHITNKWAVKLIAFLSPAAFGVYLIHMQPQLHDKIFKSGLFDQLTSRPPILFAGSVLLIAGAIFTGAILIDKLRQLLFDLFHIKQRLSKLEDKLVQKLWDGPAD